MPVPISRSVMMLAALLVFVGLSGCEAPVHLRRLVHVYNLGKTARQTSADAALTTARHAWEAGNRDEYNTALDSLMEVNGGKISVPGAKTDMATSAGGAGNFDTIEPVLNVKITGLNEAGRVVGWGVPLVGYRANKHTQPVEKYYPPEGIIRPLTAVLVFYKDGPPHLKILDSWKQTSIDGEGQKRPLFADYTAALARLVENAQGGLMRSSIYGFMSPTGFGRDQGVFLLEPFDPKKIPVIMVHGLLSSPLVWKEITNGIWADPVLRSKYQVWHYFYPTNYPYLYTSDIFRQRLRELRSFFHASNDPAAPVNNCVVIGHSMGGLLARPLISKSEYHVWDAAFYVRPDKLNVTPAERLKLEHIFIFKPEPYLRTVIFMATPHRGSIEANRLLGFVGKLLVHVSKSYMDLLKDVDRRNPGKVSQILHDMAHGDASSVRVLAPKNSIRDAIVELEISERVDYHSIIGNKTGKGPLEKSNDGFVAYTSSHLDGAASEKIIHSEHDEPHRAEAVEEVKRILREHLAAQNTN